MVKIGKEYKWEMSHRLPFHKGPCKNVHGHSYKMLVQLEGQLNKNRMLLDFYDIDTIVNPILEKIDHSFVVNEDDNTMIDFLKKEDFKYYVMENYSTAEDLSLHFISILKPELQKYDNISKVWVRIYETEDAWAEVSEEL